LPPGSPTSDFRADPWGRLLRTLDVTLKIVFGDQRTSRQAAAQLRAVHERVTGTDDRGEAYAALDPDLLLWVHATLADTALLIYERYLGRISALERTLYWEEMKTLGGLYGIPREGHPEDWNAFRAYFERVLEEELRVTETTREVADSVLRPPLPLPARPAAQALRLVTVGTLPESLRAELGLAWGPGRQQLLAASQLAIRALLPRLPRMLRAFPPARRAA
jgi:uncharacterized protein (DUF2236 family)